MPADAVPTVNAAGESNVEVKPPGPAQAKVVAPVAAPVSVSVAPEQSVVADGVALTPVGDVSTVTAVVATEVVPQLLAAASV